MNEKFKKNLKALSRILNTVKIYSTNLSEVKNIKDLSGQFQNHTKFYQENASIDYKDKLLETLDKLASLLKWFRTALNDPIGLELYKQHQKAILYAVKCFNEQKNKLNEEVGKCYEQFPEYKIIYKAINEKDYRNMIMRFNCERTSSLVNLKGKRYKFTRDDDNQRIIITGDLIEAQNDIILTMGQKNKDYANNVKIIIENQPIADPSLTCKIH